MAEICTNLTAFFHTEQGCFSIYHHTCTYTPSEASQPLKVLNLFTGGTDAPLSPFPEYFSVKGSAKHNRALRLRLRAGAGEIPAGRAGRGLSPLLPPFPFNKFSFCSWFVFKSLRGVVLYLLRS